MPNSEILVKLFSQLVSTGLSSQFSLFHFPNNLVDDSCHYFSLNKCEPVQFSEILSY